MILNVDTHNLKHILYQRLEKITEFTSENFDSVFPLYQELELECWGDKVAKCSMKNGMMQDRTRTIPHYLKMGNWEPLPKWDINFKKPFADICIETAKKIVEQSNGQKINVSWSGGLDSTTALFSLLSVADPKQIRVICNYYSIVESGSVFDKYIKGQGIEYNLSTPVTSPQYADGRIVTGALGDQLFGNYSTLEPHEFTMNWKDYLIPKRVEIFEQMMENFPGEPINTVPELLSFFEINCKWICGKTNLKRTINKNIADRIINFYDNIDFQKWSIGRYEEKFLSEDPKTHKWPMKKFLKTLMESDKYSANKVVQTSNYLILDPHWVMLLEDGTNLYLNYFNN